jgi:hypothetical protein
MSEKVARVEQFREIVEYGIRCNVEKAQRGGLKISWRGMNQEAKVGELTFSSVDSRDMRPSSLGFSDEHLWGVTSPKLRLGRRLGLMSLVSTADKDDVLVRHLAIDSGMQMLDVKTARPLTELGELEDALSWVKSPHLADGELSRLVALTPSEVESTEPILAELAEASRKLREDLARLPGRRL